jgi:pSer/pThr/pTyr-binding forkhead associated (FHA) protein
VVEHAGPGRPAGCPGATIAGAMADDRKLSPLQSPAELKAKIEAERAGSPFLLFRDALGEQQIFTLRDDVERITVGRGPANDIWLESDSEVSRLHAELERIGSDWTIADDGLSRNGTHLNGTRVVGRRRLRDGDVVRFGNTSAAFHQPRAAKLAETDVASEVLDRASLSESQRRVLVALCRPFKESSSYATPATNQQIATELYLSVDAVKTHLRTLFAKFGIEDLPQNQKRVRLVELALRSGVLTAREL